MKLKSVSDFEEWFDVPGDSGKILFRVSAASVDSIYMESMFTKAAAGIGIASDIERLYLDAFVEVARWSHFSGGR